MPAKTTETSVPTECPRCGHPTLDLLCSTPVDSVWDVYHCARRRDCWRTSEQPSSRSWRAA
ncbi:non-oxidative hydroxyarylic acid decarboxylases subunit D [Streptomyces sp. NPDC050528]|uniref:non-oxidative hydroxyarylic acid decarboxylases subunit D n=1 Tax=Streptomyces sp. NPDC050528 TaxID=3365623 RepID=UPI0037A67AC6